MTTTSIRQALQRVVDYPNPVDDEWLTKPVHELVCRSLFQIANSGNADVRGSMARANKARKMIMDRLDGKRRAGTPPVSKTGVEITFLDLTGGELGAGSGDAVDDERGGQDGEVGGDPGVRDPADPAAGVAGDDPVLRSDSGEA